MFFVFEYLSTSKLVVYNKLSKVLQLVLVKQTVWAGSLYLHSQFNFDKIDL